MTYDSLNTLKQLVSETQNLNPLIKQKGKVADGWSRNFKQESDSFKQSLESIPRIRIPHLKPLKGSLPRKGKSQLQNYSKPMTSHQQSTKDSYQVGGRVQLQQYQPTTHSNMNSTFKGTKRHSLESGFQSLNRPYHDNSILIEHSFNPNYRLIQIQDYERSTDRNGKVGVTTHSTMH